MDQVDWAPDGDGVQTVAEDGPNPGGSIAWMVPPIDQIRLKIARSKRYLGELEANVSTILRGAPYEDKQSELSAKWAYRSFIFAILFIFAATLFPFRFFPDETAFRRSEPFLHWLSLGIANYQDFAENILLFVPFGFGLACFACKKRQQNILILIGSLVAGACVSFTVELFQVFLPTRDPSWADVAANSIGSVIGCLAFRFMAVPILQALVKLESNVEAFLCPRRAKTGFLCYAALGILVSVPLQRATRLSNWNSSYPFFLGNDPTEKRPWQGRIFEMEFANRAISSSRAKEIAASRQPLSAEDGLVVSYQPPSASKLQSTSVISSPPPSSLEPTRSGSEKGFDLASLPWAGIRVPAANVSERVAQTNQLTLRVICDTALRDEAPFGRIVSLSQDSQHVNFILSQQRSNLLFGFRTPLTGEDGEPALIASKVFATNEPKDLLVTYDGSSLRLYVNGQRDTHSLILSPGAGVFRWFLRLRMYELPGYQILYEAFLFVPLGTLPAFVTKKINEGRLRKAALISVAAITPASLLEFVLRGVTGSPFHTGDVLLRVCFVLGMVALWNSDLERWPAI
jgi:glycopeptide antibiotics resistance protein